MSVLSAYTKESTVSSPNDDGAVLPIEEDAGKVQSRINWLQSYETQRMLQDLKKESDQLLADAVGLAQVNHQQDNSKLIVKKLVEAQTLQKVIGRYAKVQ